MGDDALADLLNELEADVQRNSGRQTRAKSDDLGLDTTSASALEDLLAQLDPNNVSSHTEYQQTTFSPREHHERRITTNALNLGIEDMIKEIQAHDSDPHHGTTITTTTTYTYTAPDGSSRSSTQPAKVEQRTRAETHGLSAFMPQELPPAVPGEQTRGLDVIVCELAPTPEGPLYSSSPIFQVVQESDEASGSHDRESTQSRGSSYTGSSSTTYTEDGAVSSYDQSSYPAPRAYDRSRSSTTTHTQTHGRVDETPAQSTTQSRDSSYTQSSSQPRDDRSRSSTTTYTQTSSTQASKTPSDKSGQASKSHDHESTQSRGSSYTGSSTTYSEDGAISSHQPKDHDRSRSSTTTYTQTHTQPQTQSFTAKDQSHKSGQASKSHDHSTTQSRDSSYTQSASQPRDDRSRSSTTTYTQTHTQPHDDRSRSSTTTYTQTHNQPQTHSQSYSHDEISGDDSSIDNLLATLQSNLNADHREDDTCPDCRQQLRGAPALRAMGKKWHTDHFRCANCRKAIGTDAFFEKEGRPICANCHTTNHPTCHHCASAIVGDRIRAMGRDYHRHHFICFTCREPLEDFVEKNGNVYCLQHYNQAFSKTCGGCGQSIRGDEASITALSKTWHNRCFACDTCHNQVGAGKFYEVAGKPRCVPCVEAKRSRGYY